jgi:hypothetical protein
MAGFTALVTMYQAQVLMAKEPVLLLFRTPKIRLTDGTPAYPLWVERNEVEVRLTGHRGVFVKKTRRVWWWPWFIAYGPEIYGQLDGAMVWTHRDEQALAAVWGGTP